MTAAEILAVGIFFVLLICGGVESIILLNAFLNADTVSCTWLWCEFTSTYKNETINKTCYENNVLVNCPKITRILP